MKIYPSYYSQTEERINVISHGFGLLLSLIGMVCLVKKALLLESSMYFTTSIIYSLSLVILYGASTFYHAAKNKVLRARLNIFDHASIYLLIAGTYTPFMLVTLSGDLGILLFVIVWALAFIGIFLKLFYTGRFKLISTLMYIGMGWLVIFAFKPLLHQLAIEGVWWLFAGGIFYTFGALLFMWKKLKFNHAIFHFFVLAGSICHYLAIYYYVIPTRN
ncbi:PAQR family membrane homeostasis protein TrhA [Mesonia aestuariivivens]|uniref:PAQR family membrane homeostasis protein TrhA n=1 Tax=Mesonia aestuariivivens TaxID=2796128 RepID=UPI002103BD51|nr:hemolysin III family protein [Mesonia aestuariivivens]